MEIVFSSFEDNLLGLVRVTNQVYALCRPSHVDFGVDKCSSFVVVFFFFYFFLMKNFLFIGVDSWLRTQ